MMPHKDATPPHHPQAIIVIPCYNEAKRLDQSKFLNYLQNHPDIGFVFVDDGSRDDTHLLLQGMAAQTPHRIQIVHLKQNCGKAEAVRQGVLRSIGKKNTYIGYWDADLSTPLETIDTFVSILERHPAHLVIGARVKLLGRTIERHKSRHYLGRIFATLASMILRLPVYDTQCGAKLFRNTPLLYQIFKDPFIVNWAFDIELIARMKLITDAVEGPDAITAIIEHPLEQWIHRDGSKVQPMDFCKAPIELFKLYVMLYVPGISSLYRKKLFKDG